MKKSLRNVLFFSVLLLVFLVYDAYDSGKIHIYTEDEKGTQTVESQKPSGKNKTTAKQKKQTGKKNTDKNIRVLLSTTDFAGVYHAKAGLQGTKGMKVTQSGKTTTYPAGKKLEVSEEQKFGAITVQPLDKGTLQITTITRQKRHPSYRGKIELTWSKQGICVVNELPLEQYLYAVVPSEISTGSEMEALKAQAVCARTYARNQMEAKRYEKYNADVDDSVACQVYNNVPEDARARKAVKATNGQVVTCKGKRVQTYYYSTSWGKSASGKEVWQTGKEVSYLQSCLQQESGGTDLDLSKEEAFRRFMQKEDTVTYDKDSSWYRWSTQIMAEQLTMVIDERLQQCYRADPDKVLTQKKDGTYVKKALMPLGDVQKIRVEKREKSGLVTEIVIVGTKQVVKVCSQYNVRKVLSTDSLLIKLRSGETTVSMLPSAAIYVDSVTQDGKKAFQIIGGGFGHGTGMSQTGAAKMASLGKNYREILTFYYSGCDVTAG